MIYADSSFLASLYALDQNTAQANRIYQADRRRPLFLTAWQELELVNTFRLGLRRARRAGVPEPYRLGNCLKRLREDLAAGILRRADLPWPACVRQAGRLSEAHTEKLGTVMLDVWQVACAVELKAAAFWTFDGDQEKLAKACATFDVVVGLETIP